MHRQPRTRTQGRGSAFTLVELLIVMVIISILLAFILKAAFSGIRRAEERATQALIMKLEAGLTDRVDAILATRVDANAAHNYLAATYNSSIGVTSPLPSNNRAQIIARHEQVKAEMPDVFLVQNDPYYPMNFGAAPFPASAGTATGFIPAPYAQYLLPMGVGIVNDPTVPSFGANPPTPGGAAVTPESTGIFGASYPAMAGVMKSLVAQAVLNGATPPKPMNRGYDGVDNDGNGLVDDLAENGTSVAAAIKILLSKHTHKTARAEMAFALLVEGIGPFGSAFSRDEFTDREVRDTDGDGLPEFVDAWGEPLQFFRWPVAHVSDPGGVAKNSTQKGMGKYLATPLAGAFVSYETRERNPLDANQRLVDPFWWSSVANDSSPFGAASSPYAPLSNSAYFFQTAYTTLTDPNANASTLPFGAPASLWDRGGSARRAYYSRFLVVSGGPDKTPGVPVYDASYYTALGSYVTVPTGALSFSGASPVGVPTDVASSDANIKYIVSLRIEDQAAPATFVRSDAIYYTFTDGTTNYVFPPSDALSLGIAEAGNDDITSHNLQGPGGATR